MQQNVAAQIGPGILISEFRLIGPRGTSDEFVELFNASDTPVNIGGWTLRSANNVIFSGGVSNTFLRATVPANVTVQPGCYFLITNATSSTGYSGPVPGDLTYTTGIADDGGLAIVRNDGSIADQVGFFNTTIGQGVSAYFEGNKITSAFPLPAVNRSFERLADAAFGYRDTTDNATDFALTTSARPQNRTSPCSNLFKYPHDIQGFSRTSPFVPGTLVNVRGVVTARKANGFFLQTETANEDADALTSEGLFVSYSGAVQVGHVVIVTGRVNEVVTPADPSGASMTELNSVLGINDIGVGTIPPARVLTSVDLSPSGNVGQLERYEGMRVTAPMLSVISPTTLDGAFYAVLTGQTRPFREPGVPAGYPVLPCAAGPPCAVPVFDANPERVRVDADGLLGVASVAVSTGTVLNNVTGPLEFTARDYTLLPEAPLAPAGGMSVVTVSPAAADQFTVASLNLGAFSAARQAKASLAVRDVLHFPDVLGVQGVATVGELFDLAAQVNLDAAGAVQYQPYPTGNPADPLNTGFLVRSDRASAVSTDQVVSPAFDSAPVVLHATLKGPATRLPQVLTIVNSQFASLADVERADAAGAAARAKRQAQAEALADYVQGLQINGPDEAIVALGNYNAFDFNDGYVDVVGTVRGVPAPADQLALASLSLVTPPLVNPDLLNAWPEQYSSLSNGNAQSLDHVLVNANLAGQLAAFGHARINADFPEAFAADAGSPLRVSDRDPLVAYFTFKPDLVPPVFAPMENVIAEATAPGGAAVSFATPVASDNLDPSVTVTCDAVSGSTFPLGNTAVHCAAQDLAGNPANTEFTITVQDTTAPVLSTPGDQVLEASSSNGAAFDFTVTATDAVTTAPPVTCSSSSGTFPLGTTLVDCSTQDAAGNHASASFNVTVQDTTAPVLSTPGDQVLEATSSDGAAFNFTVTATDAVTTSLAVSCSSPSGTFPLGTTQVNCSTQDASGNHASALFAVTVQDTTKPVVTVPANIVAEATTSAGSVVNFTASATDAVTTVLNVVCSPLSGSVFPLGATQVTCTTQDNAGNSASSTFMVTVRDTTTPVLLLPAPITAEATSSAGRIVLFSASASDAVTESPVVSCNPASGSTFQVGSTTVNCATADAAGNAANGSFTVTVTAPPVTTMVPGHMFGVGDFGSGTGRVAFIFDVRESQYFERGWVTLTIGSGWQRNYLTSTHIDEIQFSNSDGYSPGAWPRSGVDTVVFKGTAHWNGRRGYTFEITATDRGEPGAGVDTFALKVYSSTGAVVATVSGTLHNGNIQSLR